MTLYLATAWTDPRVHADHQANYAGNLNDTQREEVLDDWNLQIEAVIPSSTRSDWRDRGYEVVSRQEAIDRLLAHIEGDVQHIGGGDAVRPIVYSSGGTMWQSCGPRCHFGYSNLAIMQPDAVRIFMVQSTLYEAHNGNTPWNGVVRIRVQATRLL